MIGIKIVKPLQDNELPVYEDVPVLDENGAQKTERLLVGYEQNPAPNTLDKYSELAQWCNENRATIVDQGDYYECVALPEPSIDELRNNKLQTLDIIFMSWRDDGATLISSLGFEADCDERAMIDVNGLVTVCGETETVVFMGADNQPHELSLEQLKVLQAEIIKSGSMAYQTKWMLRTQIVSATTKGELDAIEIEFLPVDFTVV